MPQFSSPALILVLALLSLSRGLAAPLPPAEYRPVDQKFYLPATVLKADPSAVILNAKHFEKKGDSYFFTPRKKAPHEIYMEVLKEWLEPVTPPSMPDSLGVAPDVMQIREPQGDVQVGIPGKSDSFVPVSEGMPIVNGSIVRTGKDGTAAILFGGIDSARLAPSSEALVQQTVMPELRSTRIDLRSGIVFNKVGLRPGEKQDYEVHTPFGTAAAKGTDFVCFALPGRTDVFIAQGTVRLSEPDGGVVGTAHSTGKGALQFLRFPAIPDAHQAMDATAESLTAAIGFLPTANVKLKALHDEVAQGVKMTSQETAYVGLIKHVPCLVRLALVEPMMPAPAPVIPAPKPQPITSETSAPKLAVKPSAVAAPAHRAKPVAVDASTPNPAPPSAAIAQTLSKSTPSAKPSSTQVILHVWRDGSVDLAGERSTLSELEPRLERIADKAPDCRVVILANRKTARSDLNALVALCHRLKLENLTLPPGFSDAENKTP